MYFKILYALVTFKPDKIYYTASIRSIALYRDILVSTLWKIYSKFKNVEIFYHYHTKGVDEYVSKSKLNLFLTKFFIKDVNLIQDIFESKLKYKTSNSTLRYKQPNIQDF